MPAHAQQATLPQAGATSATSATVAKLRAAVEPLPPIDDADLGSLLRDRHLVWAHNSDPGNAAATSWDDARRDPQFDPWRWFEQSRAPTPLAAPVLQGVPDTCPFGI